MKSLSLIVVAILLFLKLWNEYKFSKFIDKK